MHRSRVFRAIAWVSAALLTLVLLAVGFIYFSTERMLRRQHDIPLQAFNALKAPTAVDLAEGRRMSAIVGCWAGCHGMKGEGGSEDAPYIFSATAPTLSAVLPRYSDEELVRLIRFGVKRDGRTALGMISGTFNPLSDADLARIIAHLRRQPASKPVPEKRTVALGGRMALLSGDWKTSVDEVDRSMPRWGELPRNTSFERGRYLVSITCTECHGLDLQGEAFEKSPPMDIVRAYNIDQFRVLMRTGKPISGRDLGIMSWTARFGFSHFKDDEIRDIHNYLLEYRKGLPTNASTASSATN